MITAKKQIRLKRKIRVRKMLLSRSDLPRVIVTRSNQHFYAQIIDDKGKVLASASSSNSSNLSNPTNKTNQAAAVGVQLAAKAAKAKVAAVVLDRSFYRYHGRVKAFVESARTNGLKI